MLSVIPSDFQGLWRLNNWTYYSSLRSEHDLSGCPTRKSCLLQDLPLVNRTLMSPQSSDNRIYWNINKYSIEKIINMQHVTCFKFQPTKRFHFKYNYWLRLKLSELLKNEKLLKFQCRNENLITIHTIELLHTRNFEWQDFLWLGRWVFCHHQ